MTRSLFALDRNQPQVMGVLNVTPDSFSDGGQYFAGNRLNLDACRRRAEQMVAEGASLIDIGGESTRPGAKPVSIGEEMDRVLPVVEALQDLPAVISVDTSSPAVMKEAADLGVGLLNDVRALQRDGALAEVAALDVPVCLMHMQGEPQSMQSDPRYRDVTGQVSAFFTERLAACEMAGIKRERLLLDPGFGFGKTLAHNARLLRELAQFETFGLPILVGLSRKSMISRILPDKPVDQRMPASITLAVIAVQNGAWIIRAHDVAATVDAVKVAAFMMRENHD